MSSEVEVHISLTWYHMGRPFVVRTMTHIPDAKGVTESSLLKRITPRLSVAWRSAQAGLDQETDS